MLKAKQLPVGTPVAVGTILRCSGGQRFVIVMRVVPNVAQPRHSAPNYTLVEVLPLGRIHKGVSVPARRLRPFVLGQLAGDNPRPLEMGMVAGCAYRIVELRNV